MTKKIDDKKEYVDVEGIKCEVKDPSKKKLALFCQKSLYKAISDYEGSVDRWIESKKSYRDVLVTNLIITPFVLGWLKKPDPDEYLVIIGSMTMSELKAKKKKDSKSKKTVKETMPKSDSENK